MRRFAVLVSMLLALLVLASDVLAGQVRGYDRRDGTPVRPHQRTNPDSNPYNNYNFPGNYNPNTGRITPGNPDTSLDRDNRPRSGSGVGSNAYGLSNPYGND